MFYENYVRLCNSLKKTPSAVALEIGIAKPTVTRWKNGSFPNSATLYKIADFFGVTVEELISEQKETPTLLAESEPFDGYSDLTDEEKQKVKEYAAFLLASRHKK